MHHSIQAKRLYEALILVVDDVAMNRKVLSQSLNAHGYKNIMVACDGLEALKITEEHQPDLVILDLMMPGMDGFAYCQAVRRKKAYDYMPIIVQTALSDLEQKLRAFQMGANDYICKPIDPGELSARTQVHLNQKLMTEDLLAYQSRMTTELDSARKMQDKLMPNPHQIQVCERVFDLKIAQHFETSSALGGDCWGIRPLSDQRLALYMFDFSGRGMTSAMNVFRMHTIMQDLIQDGGDPSQFLLKLNRQLYPLLGRDELATMFYGIIDIDANCLLYAAAAVPPAFIFPASGEAPVVLQNRGFPLGVEENVSFETKYIPFNPGDLLVLFSDCIIETQNSEGKFLSENDVTTAIKSALDKKPENPAQSAVDALTQRLTGHNPAPIFDDNTITAYWRCPDFN